MACTECKVDDSEWIACEVCDEWFHFACCGIERDKVSDIVEFHCADCVPEHGPSVEKLRSKRRRVQYNYAQLDKGIIEVSGTHLHAGRFTDKWPAHPFPVVDGNSLPKLETPIIIESKDYDTLGMVIPAGIDANHVAETLGPEMPVPVVDVATQDILPGWTLGKWVEYFNSKDRKRVYNVISLEFSQTPLKAEIVRPTFVRDHDLVDKVWPADAPNKPEVGYYCLMGVKGSYTDFHVDFGGTSVYYHIVKGAKTFLFVPPTPSNMRAYEKWCKNPDQSTTWFPDTLSKPQCWRVDLKSGDTMLLPSGWIHAVYTPADSFVIGGNFLSIEFLQSHLRVSSLEQRIMTPKKFTFPNFQQTLRYLQARVDAGEIDLDETTRELLGEYTAEESKVKNTKLADTKPDSSVPSVSSVSVPSVPKPETRESSIESSIESSVPKAELAHSKSKPEPLV